MAFFKFRKASAEPTRTPVAPQSIEALRQRAKYRLAGASVLVLLGVIGFPLLFDKQPRSVALDTPIDIPDRNKVLPLAFPAAPGSAPLANPPAAVAPAPPPASAEPVAASTAVVASGSAESKPAVAVSSAAKVAAASAVPAPPVVDKKVPVPQVNSSKEATNAVANSASKPSDAASPKASDAGHAQAVLDDHAVPAPDTGRYVVQVGAFAEVDRAREVRAKLEKSGLKTYTQVADTKDGKRIRVRVGPFASKPDAKKAAEKIKQLNLPAAVLTL
jgi:DedD protein